MKSSIVHILSVGVCVFVVGCGKEEPAEVTPPPQEQTPAATAPAAQQPAAAPVAAPAQASPAAVQQLEAAIKAKQYDQVANKLIELINAARKLPPQQASPLNFQILQLKMQLQEAVANGEPGAAQAMQRVMAAGR